MKKILKFVVLFAIALLIIIVAFGIILKLYYPPDKIKNIVISKVEFSLKRKIKIDEVSLSLIKGLSMRNISISEYPDFSKGEFLKIKSLKLKISIIPMILNKTLIIKKFKMINPFIKIIKYPDNTFNFETLIKKEEKTESLSKNKKESQDAFRIETDRFEIKNGSIVFEDYSKTEKTTYSVKNINIKASGRSIGSPVDFSISNIIEIKNLPKLKNIVTLNLLFKGSLDILKQKIILKDSNISSEIFKIVINGNAENLKSPKLNFKVNYDIFTDNANYYLIFDTETITMKNKIKGSMEVTGTKENLNINGKMDLNSLKIDIKNLFKKTDIVPLNFKYSIILKNLNSINLNWLIIRFSENQISLTGFLRKNGFYKINADVEDFKVEDIKNYLLPIKKYDVSGNLGLTMLLKPDEFKGILNISKLTYLYRWPGRQDFINLSDIKTDIEFDNNNINVKKITGKFNEGEFIFSGNFKNYLNPNQLLARINLFTKNISFIIPKIKKQKSEKEKISEQKKGNFSPDINITGNMNLINTHIKNIPVIKNILKTLKIEKELKEITAKRTKLNFKIHKSKLDIKTFKMLSDKLKIYSKGTLYLNNLKLDFDTDLRVKHGILRGDFSKYTLDENGWNKVEIKIRGTLNSPLIKLKTEQIIKKAIEDKGKKLLEKGLKNLFKK